MRRPRWASSAAAGPPARMRTALGAHLSDPLFRHSYLLLGSVAVSAAGGFLFWLASARLADPEDVGRAAGMVASVSLLSYLTSLGLPYGLLRFGAADSGLGALVNGALLTSALASLAAAAVFVAGSAWWAPDLESLLDEPLELALFAAVNVAFAVTVLLDSFLAARRAAQYALARAVLLTLGRFALLAPLATHGAEALYVAATAPFVLTAAGALAALGRIEPRYRVRAAPVDAGTRALLGYSVRNFPSALLGGAPPFVLPVMVLAIVGPRDNAVFYVAWSLISILLMVPGTIANLVISEGARDDPWGVVRRARGLALRIVAPACAVLLVAAGPILAVFGDAYRDGAGMMRILALSVVPWAVMAVTLGGLRVEGRYAVMTASMLALAVLTLGGALALGTAWGLDGIAAGWALGALVTAAGLEAHVRLGGLAGRAARAEAPGEVAGGVALPAPPPEGAPW